MISKNVKQIVESPSNGVIRKMFEEGALLKQKFGAEIQARQASESRRGDESKNDARRWYRWIERSIRCGKRLDEKHRLVSDIDVQCVLRIW